jgi:hypothetical protein
VARRLYRRVRSPTTGARELKVARAAVIAGATAGRSSDTAPRLMPLRMLLPARVPAMRWFKRQQTPLTHEQAIRALHQLEHEKEKFDKPAAPNSIDSPNDVSDAAMLDGLL